MKEYEEKEVKWLISKPRGLFLRRRRRSLRRAGVEQEINYYPFGLPYYDAFNSQDGVYPEKQPYKFGGKEYDEMHGLNWYDQGARPFWGIIPITPTMDPLVEKNYSVSPYVQWGNNPVNNIDPTGKDYIMFIDQENSMITISATYYASTQDMASAQQAVDYWNNQSGNFTYQTKDGGNYTVNFSLTAVEVQTDASMSSKEVTGVLNTALSNDKNGGGNVFQVVDDSKLGVNVNGTTSGGNFTQIKDAQKSADTGAHEMGHTLGLVHSSSGLMTPSSTDNRRSGDLNTGGLNGMITNPLRGRTGSEGGNNAGKGTVIYFNSSYSTERLYNPLNSKGKIGR